MLTAVDMQTGVICGTVLTAVGMQTGVIFGTVLAAVGMQTGVIFGDQPYGLPLTVKLMPQYLKPLGYRSHIVGKVSGVHRSVVMAMPCFRDAGMQHHVILGQNPGTCRWRSLSCLNILTH